MYVVGFAETVVDLLKVSLNIAKCMAYVSRLIIRKNELG